MDNTVLQFVAIATTTLFILKLLGGLIFGDTDYVDNIETEGESGGNFISFSISSVLAFMMMFSWTYLGVHEEMGVGKGLAIAFVAGTAMMMAYSFMIRKLFSLNSPEVSEAVLSKGSSARVYTSIEGRAKKSGLVKATVNGAERTLDAFTNDTKTIATGESVLVESHDNGRLFVTRA
ncbi:hypothetical protein [Neptuniibacter sp. QD37_11]|uniref:hypothetical protein n=1 Tax=Neptuniibacter sp. QD37_11 TaxID=3398209 RepID=UPI0039F4666A